MNLYAGWARPGSTSRDRIGIKTILAGTALCCLCPLIATPLWGQTAARDTLPVVRRVLIEGNEAFGDSEIKRAIRTRASGCKSFLLGPLCWFGFGAFQRLERFQPRELRTDVLRIKIFYFRRGYRRAEVDTTVVRYDNSVDVTFLIDEGPPIVVRNIGFAGFEGILDSTRVLADLPLREGEPFSELDLTASREALERRLRNDGYAEAQVLVQASLPASDSLGAFVTLRAVPGPRVRVGKIEVTGNREVDADDIRRLLSFRSGDVYREDEIIRSQRTLYSMALFDYVDIAREAEPSDSFIDIRVQVNEADAKQVRLGFGLTTAECFQIEAGWTHRNFLGNTRVLSVSGGLSNLGTARLAQKFPCNQAGVLTDDEKAQDAFNSLTWRVRTDFQQPWFLGTENTLALSVFGARQSLPDIYATRTFGGDISLIRQLAVATPLSFRYHPEFNRLDEGSSSVLFCVTFGVCRPEDVGELAESRLLAWVDVSLSRARTDAVLNPTRGYRFTLEAEHASRFTGSDWAYYRTQGEVSWYRQLGARSVLALRLRGGLVRPIGAGIEDADINRIGEPVTNPLKRQYAGGGATVRGYGQNLLGPKVLFASADRLADPDSSATNCGLTDASFTENNTWICDPTLAGLTANDVDPRPVGGENAVVANVELRFPLSGDVLLGAAFIDIGRVWTTDPATNSDFPWAWSPGVGIRYLSPVGPLRLDIGYNTGGSERLIVVSEVANNVVQLGDKDDNPILFEYDPFDTFLSRLQLHFSIGQAF